MARAFITLYGIAERQRAKACANCGASFSRDPRNTWAYWERAKYCSRSCFGAAHKSAAAKRRPPIEDAFARWHDRGDGCWSWRGALDKDGYGIFSYAKKTYRAASMALRLDGRPVPKGMHACHHCDNPSCVRPDHLYVGSPTENMADAKARNRLRPKTKLSANEVAEIRAAGGTHSVIAGAFGVSRSTVSMIKSRRIWAHLP